jgi:hypothetical protein
MARTKWNRSRGKEIPNGSGWGHHQRGIKKFMRNLYLQELKRKWVMRGYNNQLAGGPIAELIRMAWTERTTARGSGIGKKGSSKTQEIATASIVKVMN